MQKLISKYGLAAHLAFTAVAPQFFSLGTVLCLVPLSFCWLLFEPSRLGDESLHAARRRVAASMMADPVFWVSVVIFFYCLVQFFNTGIGMSYDVESDKWMLSQATLPALPGSASGSGGKELAAATALVVVLQGCRNAMGRMGRGAFMVLYSAFSGIGGLVYCILSSVGVEWVRSITSCSFSDPGYIGVFHGVALVCAVSAFSTVLHYGWHKAVLFLLVAVVGNAAALFVFSPPAVATVYFSAVAVLCVYAVFWHYSVDNPAQGLVFLVGTVFFLMGAAVLSMVALPSSLMDGKTAPFIGAMPFLPPDFMVLHSSLSDVSLSIWKKCPWLGTGLGSFVDAMKFTASEGFWDVVPSVQQTPLALHWMVLVERGAIGAFVVVSVLSLLLYTYMRRWILSIKSLPQPAALSGLVLLAACVVDSLFDVSLLSAGAFTGFLVMLSVSASTFAKVKNNV